MKFFLDMTTAEIEYLILTHHWPNKFEENKAWECFIELRKIVDFIHERVLRQPDPSLCPCQHCESIRNRKVKPQPPPKPEKEKPPIFSLDN